MNQEKINYGAFIAALFSIAGIVKVIFSSIKLKLFAEYMDFSPFFNFSMGIALTLLFFLALEAYFLPVIFIITTKGVTFNLTYNQLKITPLILGSLYLTFTSNISLDMILISLLTALIILLLNIIFKRSIFDSSSKLDCELCKVSYRTLYYFESAISIVFLSYFLFVLFYITKYTDPLPKINIHLLILTVLSASYMITIINKIMLYLKTINNSK